MEWLDTDGVWSEVWTGVGEFPVAARCSVYRKDWGERKATAVCRWDSYAQYFGNPAKLSPTWDKMPDVMLGKCAESLAIRKAFPAEMSAVAAALAGMVNVNVPATMLCDPNVNTATASFDDDVSL